MQTRWYIKLCKLDGIVNRMKTPQLVGMGRLWLMYKRYYIKDKEQND